MSETMTAMERLLCDEVDALGGKLANAIWRSFVLAALLEEATAELSRVRGERDKALAERDHAREWAVVISSTPDWKPE
jgi:hypothetical protein